MSIIAGSEDWHWSILIFILCTLSLHGICHSCHAQLKSLFSAPGFQWQSLYKATLCTTKVYVGTELHCKPWFVWCEPLKYYITCLGPCSCAAWNSDKKWPFFACSLWNTKNEKCRGRPPLFNDIDPPCGPWCTTCRLVVHNVVLYPRGGAQHSSQKPGQTGGQTLT